MRMTTATLVAAVALLCGGPALAQDAPAVEQGRQVYEYWCETCHGPGPRYPGTAALQAKYQGAIPPVLADRTDLTETAIRTVVRRGLSIMPMFRKTEVSDADLDALVAYLRRPRTPTVPGTGAR